MNEKLLSEVKSKIFDALENITFDVFVLGGHEDEVSVSEQKEYMEQGIEWFMTHFYERG